MTEKLKKGEISKKILLTVAAGAAAGGLVLIFGAMPGLPRAIKPFVDWYKKQNRKGRYRIRKSFEQLRRERLISIEESAEGKTKVILTEKGKKKTLEYQFQDLQIKPMPKWDKKWRMVIFDIPEKYKKARDALRRKLQELNFHQLQKSVWIHPYECRDEIDFITELFSISPYVRFVEVKRFDGDKIIKEKFKI